MAGIVTRPLSIFRRPDSPKPMHARWGDVGISVPTEGSWNQFDNPHRRALEERQKYGPGFVPGIPSSDKSTTSKDDDREQELEEEEEAEKPLPPLPKRISTIGRSNSLSIGALRPSRLSVRLASRPKPSDFEETAEKESSEEGTKKVDFAYKPIKQDYTAEAKETSKRNSTAPFRYVQTNANYLEDKQRVTRRSQSARPYQNSDRRRDSFTEPLSEKDGNCQPSAPVEQSSRKDEKRKSFRLSISDRLDSLGSNGDYEMPPRRRTSPFVPADRKRGSLMRPMTLTMVPDSEDLF